MPVKLDRADLALIREALSLLKGRAGVDELLTRIEAFIRITRR